VSCARTFATATTTAALALTLALAAPCGAIARASQAFPTPTPGSIAPRTSLPTVENEVMCVTCKISLSVADSPQADRERTYIQRLIDEGRTLGQIKRALVFQYGPTVLALPPSHGFDLGVYIVPSAVVLTLVVTVALLLPRWRRRARAAREAEGMPSQSALSPADAARLEADMARFD
jgi:cytochrome c-type biogenesis protein CcmH